MKNQISVGRLKEILSDIDDNYIVQLGINEETDLLTHIFIDSDSGVVDLTNFEDRENEDAICLDAFGNELYSGDKILEADCCNGKIYKGKIERVYSGVVIGRALVTSLPEKTHKIKNVIRYEW